MPWVIVPSRNIVISGVSAEGTNFGKPGYLNIILSIFFIVFTLIPRLWAKRANLVVVALNIAWAIRNYLLLSACRGGDCPEKQAGLYLLIFSSLFILVSGLFPDLRLDKKNNTHIIKA